VFSFCVLPSKFLGGLLLLLLFSLSLFNGEKLLSLC